MNSKKDGQNTISQSESGALPTGLGIGEDGMSSCNRKYDILISHAGGVVYEAKDTNISLLCKSARGVIVIGRAFGE